MISTLNKIYRFSGKMQGTMKKVILFSVLHSLFDMMSFGALALVFSGLIDGFTTSMIWMVFGITLISMLLKIWCSYISDFGKVQIGYFMCAEKRIHIGDRIKYMPMGYFSDHNLGNLTSVVTTTMSDIENNASMVLTNILGGYIHAAIITVIMLCIDWRIGVTILCGILLFTWCISRLQKKAEIISPQRQQAQETLVSNVLEYVQGMLIVKSFNLGQNSNSKMKQAIMDSKDKNLKLERTFVPYNMLQQILLYGTSILVIVEGLCFYLEGTMELSICLLMTVASFMLFGQLQSAGNTSALLRLLDVSIDKVEEIDKTPVMDEHGKPTKPENFNIVFDDVSFSYGEHKILDHVSLTIPEKKTTAIVGPSGAGKSTLSAVLTGRERFEVTQGEVEFNGKNLLEMPAEDRAREGIFLSFQYPVEIPGVSTVNFLKTAVNEIRKYHGQPPYPAGDFLKMIRQKMELVGIDNKLLNRSLNEGFSGGEKKKNEIFQMAVLEPKLAILDETDSGLDIDALRTVANGVNKLKKPENATIVITHYQRLLDYIVPDVVHVLYDGRIVKTAGKELVAELEEKGYDWIKEEVKGK